MRRNGTTMNDNETKSRLLLLMAMALGVVVGWVTAPRVVGTTPAYGPLTKDMACLAQAIAENYVDTLPLDTLNTLLIGNVLRTLDPHSHYLPPSEVKGYEEKGRGRFCGIGVALLAVGDSLYVSEVFHRSPAQLAGIRPGDCLVAVGDSMVGGHLLHPDMQRVVDMIRGPRGTTVRLAVKRYGSETPLTFHVGRNGIFTPSVPAAIMMGQDMGYVRIESFTQTTAMEFRRALLRLKGEGMGHLVVDLRGNGGGSMAAAVGVADQLLPEGSLIVVTQGAHRKRRCLYAAANGAWEEGALTLLVDQYSASGSEIVAGAIQDNDRGRLVGRRTFGKGLVQETLGMPDGGLLLLTTQRYYTPSGRCIQRPYATASFSADTSRVYYTRKGRRVYGGGGIMPDRVLPLEVDGETEYLAMLTRNRLLSNCAIKYVHRYYDSLIQRYPTLDAFRQGFVVGNALANLPQPPNADVKAIVCNRYKAMVAQSLYGGDAYTQCVIGYDKDIKKIVADK